MCSKMSSKAVKILVGLVILGIAGVITLAVYFGSGQANASVTLQGDHNQSKLSQSAGLHILEINNQGDNVGCNTWTVAEYAVILLTFIILLKCTHIIHYCCWTKRQIKNSLAKERERVQIDHDKLALPNRVIVPAI